MQARSAGIVRFIEPQPIDTIRYTIGTLVNDQAAYQAMLTSFQKHGFTGPETEFLAIDNSHGNRLDGYDGLNRLLTEARGHYVILCHQDVRMVDDDRDTLDCCLGQLEAAHPEWAVAGNAGGVVPGVGAVCITDPTMGRVRLGTLPQRVLGLDENFLVVKRAANLALSRNIGGFHLYGTDLCQVAMMLGWSCYVIPFHLEHLSGGTIDAVFHRVRRAFIGKWRQTLRPRWVLSPNAEFYLTANRVVEFLLNCRIVYSAIREWNINNGKLTLPGVTRRVVKESYKYVRRHLILR